MDEASIRSVAIIGFGEVGRIFAQDLAGADRDVIVYDRLFNSSKRKISLDGSHSDKIVEAASLQQAFERAELIISVITASSALQFVKEASAFLRRGQIFMDMNSVSPDTKKLIREEVDRTGADFIEAAIMAPVKPLRLKVPILLGGARASQVGNQLQMIGMDATAVSETIGVASAIKMCRSVMMKGLAALTIESLFAARKYGAEDAVIASFDKTYPGMGWAQGLPDMLVWRAVEHSRRRAAEMREVVETLKAVGMNYRMASSTADLQDWLTSEMESMDTLLKWDEPLSWREFADAISDSSETEEQ